MKDNRYLISILMLLLSIGPIGCRTTSQNSEHGLAGLATTSAVLIAVPLVPVAAAYHLLNQTWRKDAEEREKWKSLLDPVYKERISMIQERSPDEDAMRIASDGHIVYFPSVLRREPRYDLGAYYPIVDDLWDSDPDKRDNVERIRQNELAQYLWVLLSDDPFHEEQKSIPYFSETYREFISASFRYKGEFNRAMYSIASNQTR